MILWPFKTLSVLFTFDISNLSLSCGSCHELAVFFTTFPKGRIYLAIPRRLLSLLKHKHIALFNQFLDLVFLVFCLVFTLVVIASSLRKHIKLVKLSCI